jgi:mannose-1-phosphate guanylyltransferase
MILAAGLGTRLQPLTLVRPKVLIPVRGVPVLDFWIERLHFCGFEDAILNAFHLKASVADAVSRKNWPVRIEVLHEPELLGTGGGIRTALGMLRDEPLAVINGDIICNAPLDVLYEQHVRSGAEVSMLLHDWPEFNNVAVGEDSEILGFGSEAEEMRLNGNGVRKLAFTGIHFINPSALEGCRPGVPGDILDMYRKLIARGSGPKALFSPGLFWREMGSVESYKKLTGELALFGAGYLPPLCTGQQIEIHPESVVAPDVELKGSVVAGRGVRIGEGVRLENVIIWDDVQIGAGSCLKECIVADGMKVTGNHSDEILVPGQK